MTQPIQPSTSDGTTIYNIPNATSTNAGLAPASGGGTTNFLRADGTWAAPGGGSGPSVGVNNQTPVSTGTVALAIPSQPLVPVSGIIQSLPPGNTYSIGPDTLDFAYSVNMEGICTGPDGTVWLTSFVNSHVININFTGTKLHDFDFSSDSTPTRSMCFGNNGFLYVGDSSGNQQVLKIDTSAGTKTNISASGSTPGSGACSGADGFIYFGNVGSGKHLFKVHPSTNVVTSLTNTSGYDVTPTALADGTVLYFSFTGAKLGKIDSSGNVTEVAFPVGLSGSRPIGSGPDGLIYMCARGSGSGGYTSGHNYLLKYSIGLSLLASYDLGAYGSGFSSADGMRITNGPDGWMYAGLADGATLLRFNSTGQVSSITTNGVRFATIDGAGNLRYIQTSNLANSRSISFMQTSGPRNCVTPITTVSGSTAGTLTWSMPEQGTSYKKVVIELNAFNDAGTTITFPTAFFYTPSFFVGSTNTPVTPTAVLTGQIVLPSTSGAKTGVITVVGI